MYRRDCNCFTSPYFLWLYPYALTRCRISHEVVRSLLCLDLVLTQDVLSAGVSGLLQGELLQELLSVRLQLL